MKLMKLLTKGRNISRWIFFFFSVLYLSLYLHWDEVEEQTTFPAARKQMPEDRCAYNHNPSARQQRSRLLLLHWLQKHVKKVPPNA